MNTRDQILRGIAQVLRNGQAQDEPTLSALASVVRQFTGNAYGDNNWRSAFGRAISGGYHYADSLHAIWLDYGYPETLTFFHFWNMYRRSGIARNVVELPVDIGWIDNPEIEASSKMLAELEALDKRIYLWKRIKGLDARQRVGRYAGLFMRVRDGLSPEKPIEKKLPGEGALMQVIPLFEGQLKVLETDQDIKSETYGLPIMYQYFSSGTGGRDERSATSVNIHPSRLIMAAEGADDGNIYGTPALEAPFNSLMDLQKIIGGGAEGFYKNAAQSVVFGLKDMAGMKGNEALLEAFTENYDDFSQNRHRRAMIAPGMDPTLLAGSLASPKDHFTIALNDVAAASGIPATVLIGQQTGRLASTEDGKSMLSRGNSRRKNFQTELVTSVIEWLMKYGVLPASDFEVEWSDLLASSDEDKLKLAGSMSDINYKQYQAGGELIFVGSEIRDAAGYEEIEQIPPSGEDDLEVPPASPPATPPPPPPSGGSA